MRDSNGCILLGTGIMGNQMAVSNSRKAMDEFRNILKGVDEFKIVIKDQFPKSWV